MKSYYDSLSPLLIAQWLIARGVPRSLAIAFLGMYVGPRIRVRFDNFIFLLQPRGCGVLTGTRSANIVGRNPVADAAARQSKQRIVGRGFQTPDRNLSLLSWVDNLVALGTNTVDVCSTLEILRQYLKLNWNLTYKQQYGDHVRRSSRP